MTGSGVDLTMKQSTDLKISGKDNWKEEDDIFYKSFQDSYASYEIWIADNHSPLYLDACLRGILKTLVIKFKKHCQVDFTNIIMMECSIDY